MLWVWVVCSAWEFLSWPEIVLQCDYLSFFNFDIDTLNLINTYKYCYKWMGALTTSEYECWENSLLMARMHWSGPKIWTKLCTDQSAPNPMWVSSVQSLDTSSQDYWHCIHHSINVKLKSPTKCDACDGNYPRYPRSRPPATSPPPLAASLPLDTGTLATSPTTAASSCTKQITLQRWGGILDYIINSLPLIWPTFRFYSNKQKYIEGIIIIIGPLHGFWNAMLFDQTLQSYPWAILATLYMIK